jgi:hypothetical protein
VVTKERQLASLTADFGDLLIGMSHILLFLEYLVIVLLVMLELKL